MPLDKSSPLNQVGTRLLGMSTVERAPWGDRLGAAIIDYIILEVVFLIFLGFLNGGQEVLMTLPSIVFYLPGLGFFAGWEGLLLFLVWVGYFSLFEAARGQTPGKWFESLRVVDPATLKPVNPGRALMRNLLRIVDWLPLFYILGFCVAGVDKKKRRLGDRVAETIVVKDEGILPDPPPRGRMTGQDG